MWGEPPDRPAQNRNKCISTHSPRVGRTPSIHARPGETVNFNSLAPCGANRSCFSRHASPQYISTHSPRVGRTTLGIITYYQNPDFNSLAPCGANQQRLESGKKPDEFQLTRPVWGEPSALSAENPAPSISTHSPRVGRTVQKKLKEAMILISTHSPRVGRTAAKFRRRKECKNFNSLAPCGANRGG